ncbi:MAG: polymerase sigma-70 factor, subfamily [Blastocatellia bacterium]|jgi:RNA polymerase sigma-70 factor (ECF subfamily)|nr:polymerase sigma-70 factor, subfamily [Blastocatellia bacterium]
MPGSESAKEVHPNSERERRLVESAQRDPARFGDLYEHYFELVYAYVVRRTRDRNEAEDLTAEVFHKALRSLPRFKWTGAPFAAWLFRIASNMISDRAKRAVREGILGSDQSDPEIRAPQSQQADLEQSEDSAALFRLVDRLAEDQRLVLRMRFAEERSISEIAHTLGRSEGAIKQLQFRALENVRKRLASGE